MPLFSLSMCSYLSTIFFFFNFPRYCLILNCVGFLLSVPKPCLHFSINHVSQRNLSTTKRNHACLWFYEFYFFKHPSGSWLSNAKNNFLMLITFSLEIWTPNIISVTSQVKQSVFLLSCVLFLWKLFTYWVKLYSILTVVLNSFSSSNHSIQQRYENHFTLITSCRK